MNNYFKMQKEINKLKEYNLHLAKSITDYEELLLEKNNIINEVADEILKELNENHHLSYGVALALRQKLIGYKEIGDSDIK